MRAIKQIAAHLPSVALVWQLVCGVSTVMAKSIPKGVEAVTPFSIGNYLGRWYEIARIDHFFERGLSKNTADYEQNEEGDIVVINRGYNAAKGMWKEARGKAKFVGSPHVGMLKVSFFGPFYGGYNVVALDPHYRYALVVGGNRKYMWLLSRQTTMPCEVIEAYLVMAQTLGFDTTQLLWVEH